MKLHRNAQRLSYSNFLPKKTIHTGYFYENIYSTDPNTFSNSVSDPLFIPYNKARTCFCKVKTAPCTSFLQTCQPYLEKKKGEQKFGPNIRRFSIGIGESHFGQQWKYIANF